MSATRSLYRPGTHSPGRRMRGVSLLEMLLVVGLIAAASLLAALVPVVTVVLAGVVGVVVMAVLTPLYDLTNAVG